MLHLSSRMIVALRNEVAAVCLYSNYVYMHTATKLCIVQRNQHTPHTHTPKENCAQEDSN